jgi:two-component system, OmpR family, phosphate regulon sensor histidine kinase PhoR
VNDAVFEALAEGVVLVEDDRVTALNPAAARLLQVDRERAVGALLIAVLRDHRMERAFERGERIEVVTRGRTLQVEAFASGLLLRDVSAARRARDDARELLAVLSHELRTPVTTIRSVLEALRFEMPNAQRDRFLEQAEAEAGRLVRLLDDLTVDVAPPAARSVPLREIAAKAVTLLAAPLAAHAVEVTLEMPGVDVWCDPDKLLQLFVNLLENAARHGPDHATVRVVAAPDPKRAGWYAIEVCDTGIALEADAFDGMFSPHTRGSGAAGRGTGLGLYIVRSIAERWGGRAWGRPLGAHGNAFGFTVPRERATARS